MWMDNYPEEFTELQKKPNDELQGKYELSPPDFFFAASCFTKIGPVWEHIYIQRKIPFINRYFNIEHAENFMKKWNHIRKI